MKVKKILLVLFTILLVFSLPIYGEGYENPSVIKLVFQLIFYLVIFIAVILVTLYGTKLIARNTKSMSASKYIRLIDAINIPGGTKIIIAEINEKIYILSANNNSTSIIDIVEKDDFNIIEENFDNYLDKYLVNNKFNYGMIKEKLGLIIRKPNGKKFKEDKTDEKQD